MQTRRLILVLLAASIASCVATAALTTTTTTTNTSSGLRVGAVQMNLVNGASNNATALMNAALIMNISLSHADQLDFINFPEYALYGKHSTSGCDKSGHAAMDGFCELIGDAGDRVDCSTAARNTSPLSTIACNVAAVAPHLTVSYNACEEGPNADGHQYNTQVVVQNGTILAKYRKYHVWAKKCFTTPSLELVTFSIADQDGTPYTFGVFTCFDILFKNPKDALIKKGVKFFSYASAIPAIAKDAVRLFSWENSVAVVNANLQLEETSVVSNGKVLVDCSNTKDNCVAITTLSH